MSRVSASERPGVLASTVFAQEAVIQLRASDFTLKEQIPIGIYSDECTMILFYVENIESRQLAEIWWLVAQQVAGPTFAACNLIREREVATAFTRLSSLNGPLHWAGMKGVPFILVYQNRLPVAFYNGERAVEPIAEYAVTLACQTGYREQIQLAGGESIKDNYEMPGYTEYTPKRTESIQYKSGTPIRKFDTGGSITLAGTRGAEAEAAREERSERAQGETPSAPPESPATTTAEGSTVRPSSETLLVPTRGSTPTRTPAAAASSAAVARPAAASPAAVARPAAASPSTDSSRTTIASIPSFGGGTAQQPEEEPETEEPEEEPEAEAEEIPPEAREVEEPEELVPTAGSAEPESMDQPEESASPVEEAVEEPASAAEELVPTAGEAAASIL